MVLLTLLQVSVFDPSIGPNNLSISLTQTSCGTEVSGVCTEPALHAAKPGSYVDSSIDFLPSTLSAGYSKTPESTCLQYTDTCSDWSRGSLPETDHQTANTFALDVANEEGLPYLAPGDCLQPASNLHGAESIVATGKRPANNAALLQCKVWERSQHYDMPLVPSLYCRYLDATCSPPVLAQDVMCHSMLTCSAVCMLQV